MLDRGRFRNPSQRAPEPEVVPEEKPGVRRCPRCDGWVDVAQVNGDYCQMCRNRDWGMFPLDGYSSIDLGEPCSGGHVEAWAYRRVGRVESFVCCFALVVGSGRLVRCGRRRHRGDLQGFLSQGVPQAAAYESKNALLLGLYRLGPESGGQRPEVLKTAQLSPGQLDGACRRNLKSGHIERSNQPEPLPVAGSAYRYRLTWRGLAYLYGRFGQGNLQEWVAGIHNNSNG